MSEEIENKTKFHYVKYGMDQIKDEQTIYNETRELAEKIVGAVDVETNNHDAIEAVQLILSEI
jgi:hypothetical protein